MDADNRILGIASSPRPCSRDYQPACLPSCNMFILLKGCHVNQQMIRSPNFFDDFLRMTAVKKMEGGEEAPENSSSVRGGERWGGRTRSDSKNRIPIDGPNAFFSQLYSTHPLIQFFSTSAILQHKRRSGVNDEQIAFMSSSINYESRVIA